MSRFDKFMVHVDIGTDEKLARLTPAERLCHITGVLAIAAKSPIRGRLLVGDIEAGAVEVSRRSGLSEQVAKSTIKKLKEVGILVPDDEYGCLRVHRWEAFNPPPKHDPTNAERQARHKARHNAGNAPGNAVSNAPGNAPRGAGNAAITPLEVEGEVKEEELAGCSPVVCGRADASSRTPSPLSIGEDRQELADHIVGVLQRGIDGLTTDEPCKRPTRAAVLAVLGGASWAVAEAAAVEARSVAQSQDRAPNIVALFAQRLQASLKEAA